VGAENYVALCCLGILVDQAAQPVPARNLDTCAFGRRIRASAGRPLAECPVRPVGVVVVGVLAEDQMQVPFAGDQHPVQALAAGTGDPPFGHGIRTGRLDGSLHYPHAGRGEHRVERRVNFVSRSRIKNLRLPAQPSRFISRLRAC
jgi:hypothetical protein